MVKPTQLPSLRFSGLYIALVALVAWFFLNGVTDIGLHTHDADTFSDNKAISQNFGYFFSPDKAQASGRPTAELAKWLAYLVGGNKPAWFHALVVITHGLATLLLATVLLQLGTTLRTSALSGLLFLVNTSYGNAVHMISSLDYPLALALGLGAVLCYINWIKTTGKVYLSATLILLGLGIGAHPGMGFIIPWALFWAWQQGHPLKKLLLQLAILAIAGLALVAVSLVATAQNTTVWGTIDQSATTGILALVANSANLLLWFLGRLLTTTHWMALPLASQSPAELAVGGFVLIGLAILVWRGAPPLKLWSVWIFFSLLPFILLHPDFVLPYPQQITRYIYWTSAGSAAILVWALEAIARRLESYRPQSGQWALAAMTIILLLSSYYTGQKTMGLSHYVSGRYHFTNDQYPAAQAQMDRAKALGADRLIAEDFLHIDQFVRLHHQPGKYSPQSLVGEWRTLLAQKPDSFLAHYYAGLTYQFIAKELDLALQHLQKSVALNPNYPRSLFALGDAQRDAEQFDQARVTWEKLIALEPDDADYLCNLGILNYRNLNNPAEAMRKWQRALAVDADHQASHFNLSVIYQEQADYNSAIPHQEALTRLEPNTLSHFIELGEFYLQVGRYQDAAQTWHQANAIAPKDPQPLYRLGSIYLNHLGQPEKTRAYFKQFLSIAPDHADAPMVRNWLDMAQESD